MQRKVYDKETKAAVIAATTAARAAGKTWLQAFEVAKQAGYTGGPAGIKKMLQAEAKKKAGGKATAKKAKAKSPAPAKAVKKGRDRIYDAATKAAIIKAAVAARKAGKTWPQALEVAQAAGFRGKRARLIRFVQSAAKAAKKPVRKAAPKARPAKAAAPAAPASDLKVLEATLSRIVKQRVRTVLDAAIALLQRARDHQA
jgi:hypothetical protein